MLWQRNGRSDELACPACQQRFPSRDIVFLCPYAGCSLRDTPLPGAFDRWPNQPLFKPRRRYAYALPCPVSAHRAYVKICPRCWERLPLATGQSSTVALVGSTVSGKTCFMTALVRQIRRRLSRSDQYEMSLEWDDQASKEYFQQLHTSLYENQQVPDLTEKATRVATLQITVRFPIRRWARQIRHGSQGVVSLVFPDPSGEYFEKMDDVYYLNYLGRADAVLLMVDPLNAEGYQDRLLREGKEPLYKVLGAADSLRTLVAALRQETGQHKGKLNKQLGIVLTKCDEPGMFDPDEERWGGLFPRQGRHYDPVRALRLSQAVEQHLEDELELSELVAAARQNFARVCFFAVSAFGAPPVREQIDGEQRQRFLSRPSPRRVEEPLLWILHEWGYL